MMKKRKVLIWDYRINIRNSGGPAGYLFNLREYVVQHNEVGNIFFLKDLLGLENTTGTLHQKYLRYLNIIYKIDFFHIWMRLNVIRAARTWYNRVSRADIKNINLNDFDIIHFHTSADLSCAIDLLCDYKGIVLLTTHSPQPLSYEIADGILAKYSILKWLIRVSLEKKELRAWRRADYIMFPVEEAVESYFSSFKLKKYIESHRYKLVFCPTSILDSSVVPDFLLFEQKMGIPKRAFVITYIGRHSAIKGYDQLKLLGERILRMFDDVYFVIAVNELPLMRLDHERWIELGWVDYGAELIASSDLFILPNKETYFDIIALEVLRGGTPMMLSLTGGNKYFYTHYPSEKKSGLFFYDYGDIEQQIKCISNLVEMKNSEGLDKFRIANKEIFKMEFTMNAYLDRYQKLVTCLK